MTSSLAEPHITGARPRTMIREISPVTAVRFTEDMLFVKLEDGREIGAPLIWFPRLAAATAEERRTWRRIGVGLGIHWPDIDEDVAVAHLFGLSD